MNKSELEALRQSHVDALAEIDRKIAELPKERVWWNKGEDIQMGFHSRLLFQTSKDRDIFDERALLEARALAEEWNDGDRYYYVKDEVMALT